MRIYLDHNATTPLDPGVLEAMRPYLTDRYGNPSSLHAEGRAARRAIEDAREVVATALSANPREIVFTSGATEANALGIASQGRSGLVLVSAVEHPSVFDAVRALGREGEAWATLPVRGDGSLDLDAYKERLQRGDARAVAVMAANNEVGSLQPLPEIVTKAHAAGASVHVDAVQALGKSALDLAAIERGSASLSAHKLGGPKGIGALLVRNLPDLIRLAHGGGQERGRRPGTENVAGIVGFGEAVRRVLEAGDGRRKALLARETEFLVALAAEHVAYQRHGPTDADRRIPGTLCLRFPGHLGQELLIACDLEGVAISLGSACSSGAAEPSRVLKAMGVPTLANLESVRISLGPDQTPAEMQEAAARIARTLRENREVAPG